MFVLPTEIKKTFYFLTPGLNLFYGFYCSQTHTQTHTHTHLVTVGHIRNNRIKIKNTQFNVKKAR